MKYLAVLLFMIRISSGWTKVADLGQKMDEICMKVAAFGQEMDNIYIYAKLSWIQPYSSVKGTEFITLNGENNGVIFYIIGFVVRD